MTYDYEDALLNQFKAKLAGERLKFYSHSPTMDKTFCDSNIIQLPVTATWKVTKDYDCNGSVYVRIYDKESEILSGKLFGEFEPVGFTGADEKGIPKTNFAEVAARVEYICERMKRQLLDNIAKEHEECLDKIYKLKEQASDE